MPRPTFPAFRSPKQHSTSQRHSSRLSIVAAVLSVSLCMACSAHAGDEWPSWRGPLNTGVATGAGFPSDWNIASNLTWKLPLADVGASTPTVTGDAIFLTANLKDQNVVKRIDWNGNVIWEKELGTKRAGKHKKGTGCNSSPVTDGKHIYAYFKSGDLGCFSLDGDLVWHSNLQEKFGEDTLWWDLGTSPVLSKDYVIIACVQSGPSYVVAFDKNSGEVAWKVDRMMDAPKEANQTYSTPQVFEYEGVEQFVVLGADHVTCHRTSDGKEIWRVGGLNPSQNGFFRSISSPVVAGDYVIAPYARGSSLTAIRLGGMGDVTDSHVVWEDSGDERNPTGADVPTPIAYDGKLYVGNDKGQVTCRELATGKILWENSLERSRTTFSASPVLADGCLYFVREDGVVFVHKADADFELVSKNELDEYTVATPVLVDGKMLIRTFEHLYCIGQ